MPVRRVGPARAAAGGRRAMGTQPTARGGVRAWCARPAVAGMLAGVAGGLAFVLLSAALLAALTEGGPALPGLLWHATPRWLVRVLLGAMLGAALGWGLGAGGDG